VKSNSKIDWQKGYFGKAYLDIYSKHFFDKKEIAQEADFVIKTLKLKRGKRVLDLACGFGKHIPYFLKRGMKVSGLDISLDYLKFAWEKIPKTHRKKTGLIRGDMRSLPYKDESFDAVVCLFNSFGYFPNAKPNPYLGVLKEARRILKPGGGFFLEITNKRAVLEMVKHSPQTLQCGPGFLIHELWDYDRGDKMLYNKTNFTIKGKSTTTGYQLRLFTRGELARLFERARLVPGISCGDYKGNPYSPGSSSFLLMIGRRKG